MEELAERQAEIFNIFSNAKRILIFWHLWGKEMSVNEIASAINSSIQNTSQHLRLMKSRDILDSRRSGQTIYYTIADSNIAKYCMYIHTKNFEELEKANLVEF